MFKKMQQWLFGEDEEDYVMEEEVNLNPSKEALDEPRKEVKKAAVSVETKQAPKEEVYEQPVVKKTINIKADEPAKPKKANPPKKTETRVKKQSNLTRTEDYKVPPLISPIYGAKEANGEYEDVQKVSIESSASKKDRFNTVISPFYGERKTAVDAYRKSVKAEKQPENNVEDTNQKADSFDYEEDNLSLDEIVSPSPLKNEDIVQYSLFGEEALTDVAEEQGIEDEEEDLPF